jgi:hypothetical protein
MKDAKSKAIEKKKNKEAGHKIASVVADQRAYEKRNPNSYSYPHWQAKALEEKYPKQTEAYGKKVGPKGKYFR